MELEPKYLEYYNELEKGVYSALQTYSNIHRGTGHFSMVTTELFEKAREIVLNYLKLNKKSYMVIFCSPRRSELLKTYFDSECFSILSSQDFYLPLGVTAFVVKEKDLFTAKNFDTGGGIIKFVSPKSVILSDIPDRFEAGTPSIINVICFARALQLIQEYDKNIFVEKAENTLSVKDILYQDDLLGLKGRDLIFKLRKALIGHNVRVPTGQGLRTYVNLDNAATTPTLLPIWEVYSKVLKSSFQIKQDMISEVKKICADFLGAPLDDFEVIFTPNTTEAINISADILKNTISNDIEPVVVNTLLDHHSNELPWRYSSRLSLIRLSVDVEGFLELSKLETILKEYNRDKLYGKKRIVLVSMCGASNVLGSFNDLESISKITHEYEAQLLVDGAQMVAHRSVSLSKIG
ncbi:MAG: aminotransferase class V-fold PLP-dependent enzyme, partial [Promethearchaeota archaeon]